MSSYVIAAPQAIAAVSGDLTGIGDAIKGAASEAAPSTTAIVAAAGDEVSAAITSLFGNYAKEFQALTARATQFHAEFGHALSAAGSQLCGRRGHECVAAGAGAAATILRQGVLLALHLSHRATAVR